MNPESDLHCFQIKTEGPPTRCEICHQSDVFSPETGICHRCLPVVPMADTTDLVSRYAQTEKTLDRDVKRIGAFQEMLLLAGIVNTWLLAE
ncbi:MAG TPA: hypothetical protein PKE58_19140, partial [Acidobacteriota bacterium]|nr:hypothetical protein [Acidobacteriota bacterium]